MVSTGFLLSIFLTVTSGQMFPEGQLDTIQENMILNETYQQQLYNDVLQSNPSSLTFYNDGLHKKLQNPPKHVKLNDQCVTDLLNVFLDLIPGVGDEDNLYALRMLDAIGKPPSGLLEGNTYWMGSYGECVRTEKVRNGQLQFRGKYCTMQILFFLRVGICVPSSCSADDINNILGYDPSWNNTINIGWITNCAEDDVPPWITGDYVTLGLIALIGFIIAIGTLYDIMIRHFYSQQEKDKNASGLLRKILLCFSILTNGEKLFSFSSGDGGELTCLNGIRALSFGWVLLGHIYSYGQGYLSNQPVMYTHYIKIPAQQLFLSATYSVDSFFFLSGFLVAYSTLKLMHKRNGMGPLGWLMYYVHRYLRLTVLYGFIILLIATLGRHVVKGPYQGNRDWNAEGCSRDWWWNILYINNFKENGNPSCHGVAWYLANDMQMFIISPIFLYLLYKWRLLGHVSCFAAILSAMIAVGVVTKDYALTVIQGSLEFQTGEQRRKGWHVYSRPYYRMGVYFIGIITGELILHKPKLSKKNLYLLTAILWLAALTLHYTLLFGMYPFHRDGARYTMGPWGNAIYNATHRIAWSIVLGWIVFASAKGLGGPINWFLSWNIWGPVARLSYAGFLFHPLVQNTLFKSVEQRIVFNNFNTAIFFTSSLVLTLACSAVLSLCIEIPFFRLQRLLLKSK